jgi:uncharacterized protein GlcG (DUF336 family)
MMTFADFRRPGALGWALAQLLVSAAPGMAQGVLTTHRVPAALANEAVGEAVAHCAGQGYAVSAVLVDADGVRQAVLRGDHAGVHTLDSAYGKAYTSSSFNSDSGAIAERLLSNPAVASLGHLPGVLLVQGGVVIKLGDEAVGAIGVAGAPGANLDEACARAGLDKIKDRLK